MTPGGCNRAGVNFGLQSLAGVKTGVKPLVTGRRESQ